MMVKDLKVFVIMSHHIPSMMATTSQPRLTTILRQDDWLITGFSGDDKVDSGSGSIRGRQVLVRTWIVKYSFEYSTSKFLYFINK